MKFDIKLRPHHVNAFINFRNKKSYLLSDEEYIDKFISKNKGYHNKDFVIFWKHFLEKLNNNQDIKFLYKNDYDIVCDNCDIKDECDNKQTNLHKLVKDLDLKSLDNLSLIEGNIYSIKDIVDDLV